MPTAGSRMVWRVALGGQRWVSDKSYVRCRWDMVVRVECVEIGILLDQAWLSQTRSASPYYIVLSFTLQGHRAFCQKTSTNLTRQLTAR